MATIKVLLKKTNSKNLAPVYISFYLDRKKIEVPAKLMVPPESFDKGKGILKNSFAYASDYNMVIEQIKSVINDIFVRYRLANKVLTDDAFWMEYNNPGKYKSFYDFCKSVQALKFKEVTEGTRKKHLSCIRSLQDFSPELAFGDLTLEFFRRFVLYLRNVRKNSEITINKTINILTGYVNEAIRQHLLLENPIHLLKLRNVQETKAEALNEAEFHRLCELHKSEVLDASTQHVLSLFLFMCFSSLHISDAKALKIEDIGEKEFCYYRAKMLNVRPRLIRVPICNALRKLINKQSRGRKSGILWDNIISDQKINQKLKTIAGMCEITINLSAKVGRHTFATIFLRNSKDFNTLKEIMGHSNIQQTTVYAHVLDSQRKKGVEVFNDYL